MRRITLSELESTGPAAAAAAPAEIADAVRAILRRVREGGRVAVDELRARFDVGAARWPALKVPRERWAEAAASLPQALRDALSSMASRVRRFALAQLEAASREASIETEPGVVCRERVRPVERVACYVPGGRHPLPSTAIMTAVPARAAGVREVWILCPDPAPTVLAAAELAGADRVLAVGGAHGVAAVAYGVEGVPRVDLVCGPGGVYVAEAKRQLHGVVGTDLPAGPSEVLVLADGSADPARVIADLDAQAEHDVAARPLLATTSAELCERVEAHARAGFRGRENAAELEAAYRGHGLCCVCADRAELRRAANAIAAEHLAVHTERPAELLDGIGSFGAAFLGGLAGEVFGDYGAGPNHVLPTAGAARFTAGLSVHTFLRRQTVLEMTAAGARTLVEETAQLARCEGLESHARAAEARNDSTPHT